jgi:hypothetical protein
VYITSDHCTSDCCTQIGGSDHVKLYQLKLYCSNVVDEVDSVVTFMSLDQFNTIDISV